MGSRAGFVVKRSGVAKAYGSRLHGSSTVSYLLRGPEEATKKFTAIEEMDEVDDVLGGEDGAAIIDWDDRVVIWMMTNCYLPAHQRLVNRMIGQVFEGWDVRMAHDLFEISEQAGVDTREYVSADDVDRWKEELQNSDLSEEEIAEQIREYEQSKQTTAEDVWEPVDVPDKLTSLHEIDDAGSWITLRQADGTLKDYFGFDSLHNCLLRGSSLATELPNLPAIDRIPSELLVTDGLFVDQQEQVVWRWHVGQVQAYEEQFAKVWPGWTFREIPGGNWAGQVELSGRDGADLACSEREILGLVVAEHAPYASGQGNDPGLVGMISTARKGCLSVTVLFGLAAVGVYGLSQSVGLTAFLGVLFAVCLYATIVVFHKTGKVMKAFDLDVSPTESNANMDRILQGLGYPTIAELKANGELPERDWEDDEDDEDEEEVAPVLPSQ